MMESLVLEAMAFIERCDQHAQMKDFMADFSATIAKFGFSYFMMTRLPALNEDAEPYVIYHSWPVEWLGRYREAAYFWHDPVSLHSLTQLRPFSWKEARSGHPRTRISQQLASEASSLGLVDGIGFPMGDPHCAQAVVSLAANQRVDLDPMSRKMLHFICLHAELRAGELYDSKRKTYAELTEREREVARWLANGKTAADVGQILGLSERTIKAHLSHIREKLNATTTTHAVARALRLRQIIL
jgi:LuxR family transcriptional regulator, quorum-sensing system regulator BjaR1